MNNILAGIPYVLILSISLSGSLHVFLKTHLVVFRQLANTLCFSFRLSLSLSDK